MTLTIQASPSQSGWRLAATRSADPPPGAELLQEAMDVGAARLRSVQVAIGSERSIWNLEWPKALLGREVALGFAGILARRCAEDQSKGHSIVVDDSHVCLSSLAFEMRQLGLAVDFGRWQRSRFIVNFFIACFAATALWLFSVARNPISALRGTSPGAVGFALHGEVSNRTTHVLRAMAREAGVVRVMVLGRPKLLLSTLAALWSSETGARRLRIGRPYDLVSAVGSIPATVQILLAGAKTVQALPTVPEFRDLVAIAYRCWIGAASCRWLMAQTCRESVVVFGHTGLADTTLLEEGWQGCGARTVHAVHGLSEGLNFTGRSDIAIFRCAHDANWHRTLGGYGLCVSVGMPNPGASQSELGLGFLLLSNYIHPMNPWYRLWGARDEKRLLSDVATALERAGKGARARYWKPHPVFDRLTASQKQAVIDAVYGNGFQVVPAKSNLEDAARGKVVACTVSTVSLELLQWGVVPILLDWQPRMSDGALARLPFRAAGTESLVRRLHEVESMVNRAVAFDEAWKMIEPASPFSLEDVRNAVHGDVSNAPSNSRGTVRIQVTPFHPNKPRLNS